MAQSRQTPRVWSDAIRGSEILANWLKLGTSAVFFWLTIGIALGAAVGGFWFFEGTTSLDRRLWVHHVRNGVGIGGRIADLPNPDGSGTRIQVPKEQVQRYTWRSYETVSRRFQESVFLGFLLAIGGTVTAAYFLRESGRTATEDQHIRGATLAPPAGFAPQTLASRHPPGSRTAQPGRLLLGRIHIPVQPPHVALAGTAILSVAGAGFVRCDSGSCGCASTG